MDPLVMQVLALATMLVLTVLFVRLLGWRADGVGTGGTAALWILFAAVFLAAGAGAVWFVPFGPEAGGVGWVPILAAGFALALVVLVAVHLPRTADERYETRAAHERERIATWAALGVLVVSVLLLVLAGAIAARHAVMAP